MGILDFFGDVRDAAGDVAGGIKGLLGNPHVQGLALGAATGFPLAGLLAAPMIRDNRERAELKHEVMRDRLAAQKQLRQHLTGRSPVLEGPTAVPTGGAQAQGGLQPITHVPGKMAGMLPNMAMPGFDQKTLGLLAQAHPDMTAQSLLGTLLPPPAAPRDFEPPEAIQLARATHNLGPNDPLTPEAIETMTKFAANDTDDMLAQTQLLIAQQKAAEAMREAEREQRTERQKFSTAEVSTNSLLRHLKEAAELNARIAPTYLASGVLASDFRRAAMKGWSEIQDLMGVDTSKARQLFADYDRLTKLNSNFILEDMGRIAGQGLGGATDSKTGLLQDASANLGIEPSANAKIYADMIEHALDMAEIEGFEVRNQETYASLAESLRDPNFGAADEPQPSPVRDTLNAALDAVTDKTKAAFSSLNDLTRQTIAKGEGLTADGVAKAKAAVNSFKGSVDEGTLSRARAFAEQGTESGLLAAQRVLDEGVQKAARVKAWTDLTADDVRSLTQEQIMALQQDMDVVQSWSSEKKQALIERMEEINAMMRQMQQQGPPQTAAAGQP